jgi:hypothetical protein
LHGGRGFLVFYSSAVRDGLISQRLWERSAESKTVRDILKGVNKLSRSRIG